MTTTVIARRQQSEESPTQKAEAKVQSAASALSAALAQREAAEKALRAAQDKAAFADNALSAAHRELRDARRAKITTDPQPERTALAREVAALSTRLADHSKLLDTKRQALAVLEAEARDVSGDDELDSDDREAKLAGLSSAAAGTRRTINRLECEQYDLKRDLAARKHEQRESQAT